MSNPGSDLGDSEAAEHHGDALGVLLSQFATGDNKDKLGWMSCGPYVWAMVFTIRVGYMIISSLFQISYELTFLHLPSIELNFCGEAWSHNGYMVVFYNKDGSRWLSYMRR
ncbi:hypothetical protein EDD18DRAFT_1113781 [Armillaria luteobubalina]|uniref:Uncharacterized protein n=1 Tax=Armillaria luteobubalina TaxID=153913 RepID=A0AA39UI66_9AGAR|nr:hypothetical protein EDD18DRAFT_1113781 [Armillaria luteobubalina]